MNDHPSTEEDLLDIEEPVELPWSVRGIKDQVITGHESVEEALARGVKITPVETGVSGETIKLNFARFKI